MSLAHAFRDIQAFFMRYDGHCLSVAFVERDPGKFCISSWAVNY